MTVGPNSDLTIDQFVYDPKSGTGKLAMSATRGVLRYVGGKLSKQDNAVTLRTSTATLAVRGGAFIANIQPNGTTEAIFVFGNGLTVVPVNGADRNHPAAGLPDHRHDRRLRRRRSRCRRSSWPSCSRSSTAAPAAPAARP